MVNNAQKKTPLELLPITLEQLAALTSTIQQLLQAIVAQQQPPPSNENLQTTGNGRSSNELSVGRINRKRKSTREHEPVSEPKPKRKHRHSMYPNVYSQGQDTVVEKPIRSTTIENARIKKNRSLDLRKSITRDKAINVEVNNDISIQANREPNTNLDIYTSNTLYQTLCLYCNTTQKFLVPHYMKQHPEYEVPIARLSPVTAQRLRAQAEKFQLNMGKIEAFCLFCEENKAMPKHHWTRHYLSHTGSQCMFACDTCNMQFKQKIDHKNCAGEAINVFDKNSSDASLVGYMCKDCNYIQIHSFAIHKHLINEHKYASISESMYEKLTLIPDITQLHSPTSEKYRFVEALQRFKCTICQKQLGNAKKFTAHFGEQHNDVDQYGCFCGEIVRKNGQKWPGAEWVASHLLKHRTDLYECMICNGVIIKRSDIDNQRANTMHHNTILKHMFRKHRDSEMKYQQVCRSLNRHTEITETTIVKMNCDLCGYQMDGTLTTALDHFNNDHPSKKFSTTGIVTKKISIFACNSTESKTTYEGGIQLLNCNVKVS